MSRALHLRTIAEGIEDPSQLAALVSLGCEFGQGYLFARPLEPGAVDLLLSRSPDIEIERAA